MLAHLIFKTYPLLYPTLKSGVFLCLLIINELAKYGKNISKNIWKCELCFVISRYESKRLWKNIK